MQTKYNLDDKFVILSREEIVDVKIIGIEITKEKIKYRIEGIYTNPMNVYEDELYRNIDDLFDFLRKQYNNGKIWLTRKNKFLSTGY